MCTSAQQCASLRPGPACDDFEIVWPAIASSLLACLALPRSNNGSKSSFSSGDRPAGSASDYLAVFKHEKRDQFGARCRRALSSPLHRYLAVLSNLARPNVDYYAALALASTTPTE